MRACSEIVFILDRSGSMSGLEKDTIGGFNSLLKKQKKECGQAYVSTILFDDRLEVLHDRKDMNEISLLTEEDYYVRGCTALLDAIGTSIDHIGKIHKYARKEDRPEKTLFIITTDGMENASRHYGYKDIKRMIERQKEKYGWEFLFLGANIDAIAEGGKLGIDADYSVRFHNDDKGIHCFYEELNETVANVRAGKRISRKWKENIEKDYNNRK